MLAQGWHEMAILALKYGGPTHPFLAAHNGPARLWCDAAADGTGACSHVQSLTSKGENFSHINIAFRTDSQLGAASEQKMTD